MPRVSATIATFLEEATAAAAVQTALAAGPAAARAAAGADPGETYILIAGTGIDYDGATDSTAAVEALIDAGIAGGVYRFRMLAGTLKLNIELPEHVILQGAGGNDLQGTDPLTNLVTCLIPNSDAAPVISIVILRGQECSHFDIEGNGAGTSLAGVRIQNAGSTYCGMGFHGHKLRISGFTDGFRFASPNGITLLGCSANWNSYGYRGVGLSDTWQLINCHGNFNTSSAVSVEAPRGVVINGGDWGNTSAPLLLADNGGNVVWENTNIEGVNNARLFETSNTNLTVRNNRVEYGGTALATAVLVRQTTVNARVHIENNRLDNPTSFGTFALPLIWETNTTGVPAATAIAQAGVMRETNAGWSSTTRAWNPDRIAIVASRTSNQTGLTTGVTTPITYGAKSTDPGSSFDIATGLFTAPVDGLYVMSAHVMVNVANANFSRIVEYIYSGDGVILKAEQNIEQYDGLSGTIQRYLLRGETWGIGFSHDKGSDMSLYATAAQSECWISIAKL